MVDANFQPHASKALWQSAPCKTEKCHIVAISESGKDVKLGWMVKWGCREGASIEKYATRFGKYSMFVAIHLLEKTFLFICLFPGDWDISVWFNPILSIFPCNAKKISMGTMIFRTYNFLKYGIQSMQFPSWFERTKEKLVLKSNTEKYFISSKFEWSWSGR